MFHNLKNYLQWGIKSLLFKHTQTQGWIEMS